MTTIAYRNGVLAGDSQATDCQLWQTRKIYRIKTSKEELLVGYAGEVHSALVFIEWLKDRNSRKPDIGHEDFDALVIAGNRRVTIWNQSLIGWEPEGKFFAIGSGGKCAMAAMHAGKGAVAAVEIACKVDPYTRGASALAKTE